MVTYLDLGDRDGFKSSSRLVRGCSGIESLKKTKRARCVGRLKERNTV